MGQAARVDPAAVRTGQGGRLGVRLESRGLVSQVFGHDEESTVPAPDIENLCRRVSGSRQVTNPVQDLSLPLAGEDPAGHGEWECGIQSVAQLMVEDRMGRLELDALEDSRTCQSDCSFRDRMGEVAGIGARDARRIRTGIEPARTARMTLPEDPPAWCAEKRVVEIAVHPCPLPGSTDRARRTGFQFRFRPGRFKSFGRWGNHAVQTGSVPGGSAGFLRGAAWAASLGVKSWRA